MNMHGRCIDAALSIVLFLTSDPLEELVDLSGRGGRNLVCEYELNPRSVGERSNDYFTSAIVS